MILARSQNHVIGNRNQLIWHLPADLKHFKSLTSGHAVIMGRKTYESIGKPLPNRTNIVISRNKKLQINGIITAGSLKEALAHAKTQGETEAFVIGGEQIYKLALPLADKIYLTVVHQDFDGDAYAPIISPETWQQENRQDFNPDEKNKFAYSFITLLKK